MAGKKGRSGRRAMPAAWHIVRGTYRADRHGPRPGPVVMGATALQVEVPPIPKAVLAGLSEPGVSFVLDVWSRYGDWAPEKLVLLRQVGAVTDTLEEYAGLIAEGGKVVVTSRGNEVAHPLLRLQAQAQRTLVLLLAALDLKEE